jgi:hypothetical protein
MRPLLYRGHACWCHHADGRISRYAHLLEGDPRDEGLLGVTHDVHELGLWDIIREDLPTTTE